MQIFDDIFTAIQKMNKENIYIFLFLILGYMISSLINKEKNPLTEEEINRKYRRSLKYFNRHQAENETFFNVIVDNNQE